jgi:threonine/homoserine/homoserine lactone efflux protein
MGDAQVIAFTLAAAVLTIAPGPDTMLVIRNVLRGGRRDGVLTTLGICSGLFVHATLSACGVSMLLMHSATAFHLLKLAGAGYLVWLGLQSLRHAVRTPPPADRLEAVVPLGSAHLRVRQPQPAWAQTLVQTRLRLVG